MSEQIASLFLFFFLNHIIFLKTKALTLMRVLSFGSQLVSSFDTWVSAMNTFQCDYIYTGSNANLFFIVNLIL